MILKGFRSGNILLGDTRTNEYYYFDSMGLRSKNMCLQSDIYKLSSVSACGLITVLDRGDGTCSIAYGIDDTYLSKVVNSPINEVYSGIRSFKYANGLPLVSDGKMLFSLEELDGFTYKMYYLPVTVSGTHLKEWYETL